MGSQLNKVPIWGTGKNNGHFLFNHNFRFEFPATSSSEWNSIFWLTAPVMMIFQHSQKRGQPCEVYPNFRKQFSWKFSFHSTLLPEFLKFSVEWFAFQKFNSFRNFWKLFQEISVPFATVSKFSKVFVECKAPNVFGLRDRRDHFKLIGLKHLANRNKR